MDKTGWLAHVREDVSGDWHRHELEDHLQDVAKLAGEFAEPFGGREWAALAGRLHDLGKYAEAFQSKIRIETEFDKDAPKIPGMYKFQHSMAGAILAENKLKPIGRILAYLIAGHHAGLPDWSDDGQAALSQRLSQTEFFDKALSGGAPEEGCPGPPPRIALQKGGDLSLWIRFLFSCLVDADYLDTERFMQPETFAGRAGYPALDDLRPKLRAHLKKLMDGAPETEVNRIRREVLDQCRAKANEAPGLFSLTVPTGGGKTLSSLAFALEHAIKHGLERIIYVIPYTSIIEQTANTFRAIFGDNLVEHHSNLDPDKRTDEDDMGRKAKQADLASENWDAPLIVTTSVQFFESLFTAKPRKCRKIHNIAGSVVILDEVQLLPPHVLIPILHVLKQLQLQYRVSPVLCTATQPDFRPWESLDGSFRGLEDVQEIVENTSELHERLKRVRVELPRDFTPLPDWDELSEELAQEEQVLAVVSTRNHARELYKRLPRDGSFHLSAAMCAAHRTRVIDKIKDRLKKKKTCRVVSTQLIEAGVDLDFPIVYRALAGLDSIAQAGGRCNREGLLKEGRVKVFVPPGRPLSGFLGLAAGVAKEVLLDDPKDPLLPELFQTFFQRLFQEIGQERLDREGVMKSLQFNKKLKFSFRRASRDFRMIDQSGQVAVLVEYGEGKGLIQELKDNGPSRNLMRKLQRSSVNLPKWFCDELELRGEIRELEPWGIKIQESTEAYSEELGLVGEAVGGRSHVI